MKRAHIVIGSVGMLFLAAAVNAQQKPNFAGTWVIVSPADAAGQEETITQDEKTLTKSHASEGGGHSMTVRLDGTQVRNVITSHGDEIVTLSKAAWEGNLLVITEKTTYPDGQKRDARFVWSLDAEGRLNLEFSENLDGKTTTSKLVYVKKSQTPATITRARSRARRTTSPGVMPWPVHIPPIPTISAPAPPMGIRAARGASAASSPRGPRFFRRAR